MRIAVLHPGAMGASIAQALLNVGHQVGWCSLERGLATRDRAQGLIEFMQLAELTEWAEGLISVCPPAAAQTLAQEVAVTRYGGLYVDANAVSPSVSQAMAGLFDEQRYVDGGIIGPPAHKMATTRLYLSGPHAPPVADWFTDSLVDARVVSERQTDASALKMAYAAYTKGHSALLLAVNAMAHAAGISTTLHEEWQLSQPQLKTLSEKMAVGVSPKAWRFAAEMEEIAATFRSFELPGEFHEGAAEVYKRMAALKDMSEAEISDVIAALNRSDDLPAS